MPMHMAAWETSASEASLTAIQAITDPALRINGTGIIVPPALPNVVCYGAMINSAVATLRAQFQSPSLRAVLNIDVSPITNGLVNPGPPIVAPIWNTPFALVPNEQLDLFVQNGANVMNRGFVLLADSAVKPVTGKIYTVRITTSISSVTNAWTFGTITFAQTLPSGTYQVVGFRLWSANGVYARFVFVGGAWRPGVPMGTAEATNEWPFFRYGNFGIWDQFTHLVPPGIEILGVIDTAQQGVVDLIKVA